MLAGASRQPLVSALRFSTCKIRRQTGSSGLPASWRPTEIGAGEERTVNRGVGLPAQRPPGRPSISISGANTHEGLSVNKSS